MEREEWAGDYEVLRRSSNRCDPDIGSSTEEIVAVNKTGNEDAIQVKPYLSRRGVGNENDLMTTPKFKHRKGDVVATRQQQSQIKLDRDTKRQNREWSENL